MIPFENMGIVRAVEGDRVVLHATTHEHKHPQCSGPYPLSADPRLGAQMRDRMGVGDTAVNLAAAGLVLNAWILSGEDRYRDWIDPKERPPEEFLDILEEYSTWPTSPQVFIDGELIGGCDITLEMYHSGELQKKLEEVFGAKAK